MYSDFRVVREFRGDSTLGFRVQKVIRRNTGAEYWVRKGPRFFQVKDAQAYREFLERQEQTYVEFEVVQ